VQSWIGGEKKKKLKLFFKEGTKRKRKRKKKKEKRKKKKEKIKPRSSQCFDIHKDPNKIFFFDQSEIKPLSSGWHLDCKEIQ